MVRKNGARLASLAAVGVLAFGALAACGSDSDGGSDGDSGSDSKATGKVGVKAVGSVLLSLIGSSSPSQFDHAQAGKHLV